MRINIGVYFCSLFWLIIELSGVISQTVTIQNVVLVNQDKVRITWTTTSIQNSNTRFIVRVNNEIEEYEWPGLCINNLLECSIS